RATRDLIAPYAKDAKPSQRLYGLMAAVDVINTIAHHDLMKASHAQLSMKEATANGEAIGDLGITIFNERHSHSEVEHTDLTTLTWYASSDISFGSFTKQFDKIFKIQTYGEA